MSQSNFRQIVEAQQSRVFSIAFRILGDRGTAEEVAQDVFLELYRALGNIESEDHLVAWLRRVSVHRATDALRRRPRTLHAAVEFQESLTHVARENQIASQGRASQVETLLLSLPEVQRSIVLLRYQEDLTPPEIAETLAMPVNTVKSHLQRALKLLRDKMERGLKEYAR